MNKEELLEMINSTINENGAGMITGKALNLALTEIVNAMGTGSGAGGEKVYMVMNEDDSGSAAPASNTSPSYEIPSFCAEHNKEVYNKLHTIWENGEELEGIFYIDATHMMRMYNGITNGYACNIVNSWDIDEFGNLHFVLFSDDGTFTYYLWSDGYLYDYQENGNSSTPE